MTFEDMTEAIEVILDTGCKGTIISDFWLGVVLSNLERGEFEVVKKSEKLCKGRYYFGETEYQVYKTVEIPIQFGNQKLWFVTEIVSGGCIPWIIGTGTQKLIGAIIDLENKELTLQKFGEKVKVDINKDGHVILKLRNSFSNFSRVVYIGHRVPDWFTNDNLWRSKCKKLHLQFGHASFESIKGMVVHSFDKTEEFKNFGQERMSVLREVCENCNICQKYKKNS